MKKLMIVVGIVALSIVSHAQWGMMQPQITPQQVDAMFASLPPGQRQAGILGYWQDVVNAANSGNVLQQQCVVSIAPIIRKYDPQYQEHLQAALQVAAFMSVCGNACVQPSMPMPRSVPTPSFMPTPAFGGGGGGNGTCPVCYGSGSCKLCHGTGTYRNYGQSVPCDRKCSACGGTGRR